VAKLTTHVLDTSSGMPAINVAIKVYQCQNDNPILVKTTQTNLDGRCDEPLLSGTHLRTGSYQIEFDVGQYFNEKGVDSPFLKDVVVRFYISDTSENYHVPLLISPFSYSTYRGS